MSLVVKRFSSLTRIKKELKVTSSLIKKSFGKIVGAAKKEQSKKLVDESTKAKLAQLNHLKKLEKEIGVLKTEIDKELSKELNKKTDNLQRKISKFRSLQEVAEANSYLLERKRKYLLIQTQEMETANERIINQNEELLQQKEEIVAQVEELNRTRDEILEKKNELEEKMSALLDQADYLHEANQVISNMHGVLAKQKDEILSKNEELLNLNQEKNNLIGIVAHDLKSPLNQIKGLVSIVKMTTPNMNPEAANCLSLIESSASRLSGMISKILDIEAIEAKTLNLNIQPTNLSESLASIMDRFQLDAVNKQINLIFDALSASFVNVDLSYANQIFENLISNAIKFSPPGKNIFVIVTDQGENVVTSVKDQGPGMNDDDKKKLFNKYQKLSAKPTGNESSTGLGLSIVKKYVEAMNGKIWCESEYGKGAAFFVSFPKARL
jgi:signal transduction histidine kinase